MATEQSRLLRKPIDYLSNAALAVKPKSLDCVVVVPTSYHSNDCEDVDHFNVLTLDELRTYLDDPWWKLLRRGILISFWIALVAIFASACIISIVEYEQKCTMNSMKTVVPVIHHVSDDATVRTNTHILSISGTAINSTAIES